MSVKTILKFVVGIGIAASAMIFYTQGVIAGFFCFVFVVVGLNTAFEALEHE